MLAGGQEVIVGAVTDPAFGKLVAFGLGGILVEVLKDITFRLAPASQRRCAVDARRHRGGRDPEGRARRRAGRPRGARRDDRERLATRRRLPGDRRNGSEPGVRDEAAARSPSTCASSSTSRRTAALPPEPGDDRPPDEPHHEAERGRGDRRVVGRGQDRQLGDEEPDQRRLRGRDLSDQPDRRRDHGEEGLQERQGRSRRDRRRGVRDSRRSSARPRSTRSARRRFPARC